MLFRRRVRPDLLTRLRVAAWPRRSWSRSAKYFAKRVLRLSGSPHAIAAGVAAGAFASFTPFIGFHYIIGFVIAFLIGGNLLAAALGNAIGNPLTLPLIWASTYHLGNAILGTRGRVIETGELSRNLAEKSFDAILPVIRPMAVGAVPLGAATALALYVVVLYSVRAFQTMRRERLAARRRERGGGQRPAPAKQSELT
jgi:uncharacterized protein (DUF2062 family)